MPDGAAHRPLPAVPPSFHWTHERWGAALRCDPLAAAHLFTTRQLEFTRPGALHDLADAVGAERVVMLKQIHGAGVCVLRRGVGLPPDPPEADAIVSDDPAVAIVVRAADCVPILLADRARGAVAAVHAGWRGTAARVAAVTVRAMREAFGTDPLDLVAAIGPSIGSCCYEVGSELVDAFAAAGHERHLIDRWFLTPARRRGTQGRLPLYLDVAGANRDQLILAGMAEAAVHMSTLCTAMHLDVLTSFRAERERATRIAGAIVARPGHTEEASPPP